jgi:hypothetical protein
MKLSFRRKRPENTPKPDESASQQKNLERPSAEEIYNQVATNARQELKRWDRRL